MATKPIQTNPVADLPVNWSTGQIVAPDGTSVGLTTQHGYNYQAGKINEALNDIGLINDAFAELPDIFIAEYGTTTFAQVNAAMQAGKIVFCLYGGLYHILEGSDGSTIYFNLLSADSANIDVTVPYVTSSGWNVQTRTFSELIIIDYSSAIAASDVANYIQNGRHPVLHSGTNYFYDYSINSSGTLVSWHGVNPSNGEILGFTLNGSSWSASEISSSAYLAGSTPSAWNMQILAGSVTPSITLPTIRLSGQSNEIRYVFTAASTNASFTPPSGVSITDGDTTSSAGGALVYTDLTQGSVYECSFAVLSNTLIGLVMKEWA